MIPAFVNPAAGGVADVESTLRKVGYFDVRLVPPAEMTRAVRQAKTAGARRVAVAGGDGSIAAAAAAVAGTGVELVVLPAGTLNHFARDHGVPTDLLAACEVACSTTVKAVDIGKVNGRLFLNTSSVGVYANFVRIRERLEPRWGYRPSSLLAATRALARVRPFQIGFETDSLTRSYDTPLAFIGIGERELKLPHLGNRVPNGRPGLHVMVVRGRTRARLVALSFAAAARGLRALARTPHLDSFLVGRCAIEQRHSTVAIDGEIVALPSPLEYELGEGALRLVVPG